MKRVLERRDLGTEHELLKSRNKKRRILESETLVRRRLVAAQHVGPVRFVHEAGRFETTNAHAGCPHKITVRKVC